MSSNISISSTLFNREKLYHVPFKKLLEDVKEANEKIAEERKEKKKEIAEIIREKLFKQEITPQEIGAYVEQEKHKLWVPKDNRARDLLVWRNAQHFLSCLPTIKQFAEKDCSAEEANINPSHIDKCIHDLNTFLKTQDPKKQAKILYDILINLIFQQLIVEFFGSIGKAHRINCDLLYDHYSGSSDLYTSLEEHLDKVCIQDPELYFPLLEFFNTTREVVNELDISDGYNFERYFQDYRFIAALKNFKKNIPDEKENLHIIIEHFLHLLKCKNNVEKINYIKIHCCNYGSKYDDYYETFNIHLIPNAPFLSKIFTYNDLCLSYKTACMSMMLNEEVRCCKDNFFDNKLLHLRHHLLFHGEVIAEEYKKVAPFLNIFYKHCLKELQILSQESSISISTNKLDNTPFEDSLCKNIPDFYSFDKTRILFKDEYAKLKKQNSNFEPTIPFSTLTTQNSKKKSLETARDIETDSSPSNENSSSETAALTVSDNSSKSLLTDHESKETIANKLSAHIDAAHSDDSLENEEWEEVPCLNVERFKKKCLFTYHPRVERWFLHPFGENLPYSHFQEYAANSPEEQLKAQIFHSFPQEVDNYLKMGKEITDVGALHPLKSGKEISNHCYRFIALPAEITHGEKVYFGLILYKIDVAKNLCVHRYFHQASNVGELFTTFRIPENLLKIIDKLPQENLELSSEKAFTSPCSTMSSIEPQIKKEKYSLIVKDPRGFTIELFSTKI